MINIIVEEKSVSKNEITEASSSPIEKIEFYEELAQPQKPLFISTLKDGKVQEGSRFTFECE